MSTSCGSFKYFPSPSLRKSSKLPVKDDTFGEKKKEKTQNINFTWKHELIFFS